MQKISISTKRKTEVIDITPKVNKLISSARVKEGICILFVPHTTCALTINENADPSVKEDILAHLSQLVPQHKDYQHLEGNSPAHIKNTLLGSSLVLMIEEGELVLGRWQGIFLAEFDGPRNREVWVKIK
jgi:secondary thiamine-phosphate synthase enzyme